MARPTRKPKVGITQPILTLEPQPVAAPTLAKTALRVLSLNCEGSRHWKLRILPFIAQHNPDVLCLQEFNICDLPRLHTLGYVYSRFMPMMKVEGKVQGILIASRTMPDAHTHQSTYYMQKRDKIIAPGRIVMPDGYGLTDHSTVPYGVLAASFDGVRVLNTHLMVTHQGISTPEQQDMAYKAIAFAQGQLGMYGNVVFCGDFNAPRGGVTWGMFAKMFTDNIPAKAVTTLDRILHLSGHKTTFNDFVVDGVFSAGNVIILNVALHFGISDHAAILFTAQAA